MRFPEGTLITYVNLSGEKRYGVVRRAEGEDNDNRVWAVWRDSEEEAIGAPVSNLSVSDDGLLRFVTTHGYQLEELYSVMSKETNSGRGSFLAFREDIKKRYG